MNTDFNIIIPFKQKSPLQSPHVRSLYKNSVINILKTSEALKIISTSPSLTHERSWGGGRVVRPYLAAE